MGQNVKPKIFVAILNQGWIRPELASLIGILRSDPRAQIDIAYCNLRPAEDNRNNTVKIALEKNYDFLISIDHDTVPLHNIIDLALLDLDVVGCAYPQWNMSDPKFPIYFLGMDKVGNAYAEHKQKDGLQEVDAVGSGAIVIARRVLEKVNEPFVRKWHNGFSITGLDFYFCEKAKAQGFKIYCHYNYLADHFKELSLLDVLNFKLYGGQPAHR